MKERNNLIFKSLIGFPIGTMMLGIMYMIIYLINGEVNFTFEVMQLSNINIFINQFFISCILFYILVLVFNVGKNLDNDKKEYKKLILLTILVILSIILTRFIAGSTNIKYIFTLIYVLSYIAIGIYMMINDIITKNNINKKLKDRKKIKQENS